MDVSSWKIVIDGFDEGIIFVDKNYKLFYQNKSANEIFGFEKEDENQNEFQIIGYNLKLFKSKK